MTGVLGERTDVLRSAGEVLGGASPGQWNAKHLPLSASSARCRRRGPRVQLLAATAGVLSLAVDPTAPPALFAALIDVSFAFATVPLLLEEFDEFVRFRAVDLALLWVPR